MLFWAKEGRYFLLKGYYLPSLVYNNDVSKNLSKIRSPTNRIREFFPKRRVMAVNKKINTALLEYAIVSNYDNRRAFAIEHNFRPGDIYNWISGTSAPSDHQRKKLCKILDISESKILLSSLGNMFKGLESAMTRWSEQHKNQLRESIPDHVAVNVLLSLKETAEQEAEEDESAEAPFYVQGPSEPSDTAK